MFWGFCSVTLIIGPEVWSRRGADMGFYEKRIKEVASDRSVVSAEKEWRPEGIYGEKHRIRVKPVRMVRMVATRICCAWPV